MKRKMLKEEKELIKKLAESYQNGQSIMVEKYVAKDIRALVRAVREECAKECDGMAAHYKSLRDKGKPEIGNIDQDTLRMFAAEDCAAAIRGGGK